MSDTQFVRLDPRKIKIGANVRTDLHADAKEFARSIKERGVLEPVTVYPDEDGAYVVLRGQRRTIVAAEVGLPDIPAQVIAKPDEADRITDQMVENLHRAAMRDGEIVSGVEQLALVGISAAQIAKRAALPRERVNAALYVADKEQTRARVIAGDLTLDEAAIFAEFEHDAQAIEQLERAKQCGRPLSHTAQRLRDEARERAVLLTEVDRLRADGLPVLDPGEVRDVHRFRLSDHVRAADGEPVPEDEWPNLPGAAVVVVSDWEYPETGDDNDDEDATNAEPVQAFTPVWICREPETAGLVQRWTYLTGTRKTDASEEDQAATAEAAREERRLVIANNKAWTSAEVVRRDWLRQFLTRKTPPQGAEALICEAVVGGQFTLTKAMDAAHPTLRELLGLDTASVYCGGLQAAERLADQQATPKAATMTTLAAVVTAWEASTGKHTWRNPNAWDARVLGALTNWGYQPSEVETLLLAAPTTNNHPTDDQSVAV
jgi:ParB family transcriptional regulator, chromosome partitioning protein